MASFMTSYIHQNVVSPQTKYPDVFSSSLFSKVTLLNYIEEHTILSKCPSYDIYHGIML